MRNLLFRRLLVSVPLVLVVSLFTFVLQALIPGDVARTLLGTTGTQQQYEALRDNLHLNEPFWVQYGSYLDGLVHGRLGSSVFTGEAVTDSIAARLPVTLSLVGFGILLSALLGVLLGVWSAVRGGVVGKVVDFLAVVGFALPSFWFGLILISLFAVELPLFPASGYVPLLTSPGEWIASLVLPAVALAMGGVAGVAKMTQDGMVEAMSQDYIRTLRACGVSRRSLIWKHALKNSSTSVVTVLGLLFVGMLSGSIVVENIFSLPGLGSLAVSATSQHDVQVVQGVAITFTVLVVVVNVLADLVQGWLNPKVRIS
ncbi:ABC transporter permease [Streptomyces sp. NBC_00988]|uniref:ABC transporter permease n=1 Tax=Streptomyces sp. NBC_00988 TaxID=2903704 RepID=UPI0038670CE6|nr:ABC transporter permease [Streptomyces sp. NBC_00988]